MVPAHLITTSSPMCTHTHKRMRPSTDNLWDNLPTELQDRITSEAAHTAHALKWRVVMNHITDVRRASCDHYDSVRVWTWHSYPEAAAHGTDCYLYDELDTLGKGCMCGEGIVKLSTFDVLDLINKAKAQGDHRRLLRYSRPNFKYLLG